MYVIKQYIAQLIVVASNNLRLSSEKIEVVAMLRDFILNSPDLQYDLSSMKKITELAKLAIKLQNAHNSVAAGKIDFMKISQQFKSQSASLVSEVNYLLGNTNPSAFKSIMEKLIAYRETSAKGDEEQKSPPAGDVVPGALPEYDDSINVFVEDETAEDEADGETIEYTVKPRESDFFELSLTGKNRKENESEEKETDGEENEEHTPVPNFQQTILKSVKRLDALLDRLKSGTIVGNELTQYIELLESNGVLCSDLGMGSLNDYHQALANALRFIDERQLKADKTIIEAMRACLIVIVAVTKKKEVDISKYKIIADNFVEHISKSK
jgi:hypothetical protein